MGSRPVVDLIAVEAWRVRRRRRKPLEVGGIFGLLCFDLAREAVKQYPEETGHRGEVGMFVSMNEVRDGVFVGCGFFESVPVD